MADRAAPRLMSPSSAQPLILASASRFRSAMLVSAGVGCQSIPSAVDEPAARAAMGRESPPVTAPRDIALRLARLKAQDVSARHHGAVVIGADQVLALDGEIGTKPADIAAARRQLSALRSRTHTLPTATVLARDGIVLWQHLAEPELTMRAFSDAFLDAYLSAAGNTVTETVGGYALEGLGGQLFERISGDYFSIIGLSLLPLLDELRRLGLLLS